MNRKLHLLAASILALGAPSLALAAPPADSEPAKAAAADTSVLPEIVVTALKRDTDLQDVPATITALKGDELRRQNVTKATDLVNLVSGLEIRPNTNGVPVTSIRGLGTNSAPNIIDQSVGEFIDGTYVGLGFQFGASLFDMSEVEVVKGTQAALLGKNTSLGGIVITTRNPGNVYATDLTLSHEFELGSNLAQVGVDLPISDTLRVRIAGQYDDREGWVYDTMQNRWGPQSISTGGRITAVWTPIDRLEVTALFQATDNKRTGNSTENINDVARLAGKGNLAPGGYPGDTTFDYRTDVDGWMGPDRLRIIGDMGLLRINYDLPNGVKLTSESSFSKATYDFHASDGWAWWNIIDLAIREPEKIYSQEFRVTSPSSGRLEYVAGLYLARDEIRMNWDHQGYGAFSSGVYNGANPPATVSNTPQAILIAETRPPVTGEILEEEYLTTKTAALFGSLTYKFNDQWSVTGSGRVTREGREAHYLRNFLIGVPDPTSPVTLAGGTCLRSNNGFTFSTYVSTCSAAGGGFAGLGTKTIPYDNYFDGSASLNYKPTDRILLYASYSKGTKGANLISNIAGVPAAYFAPEIAYTAELGAKTEFRDTPFGDLRADASVFQIYLDNLQVSVFSPGSTTGGNRNVKTEGVDLDLAWRPPVAGLQFSSTVEFLDAENRNSPGDPTPVGVGTRPVQTPPYQGNVRAQYDRDLTDAYSLSFMAAVDFRGRMQLRELVKPGANPCNPTATVFTNSCQYPIAAPYAEFDVRIGLRNRPGGWEVALIGKNLNDEHVIDQVVPSVSGGTSLATSEPGRTVALQFSIKR